MSLIRRAERFLGARAAAEPFGSVVEGMEPLGEADRRREAVRLAPTIRGMATTDHLMVGHFSDAPVVLDFLSRGAAPRLAALGTPCPDHFLRTKVKPLLLDMPPTAPLDARVERLRELHTAYRADYAAYYDATQSPIRRRCGAPIQLSSWCPEWGCGVSAQTRRRLE